MGRGRVSCKLVYEQDPKGKLVSLKTESSRHAVTYKIMCEAL